MVAAMATSTFGSTAWADARAEAKRHFKRGMAHIQAGRYEQGIAILEKAYAALPHPVVLFNIARAHSDAGNLQQALTYYRRYLASDPADADAVNKSVANLERRIAKQKAAAQKAQQTKPETKTATKEKTTSKPVAKPTPATSASCPVAAWLAIA